MKRRLSRSKLIVFLTAALASCFALSSCDGENTNIDSNSHNDSQCDVSSIWSYDNQQHWHYDNCRDSDEKHDVGPHSFVTSGTSATYEEDGTIQYRCTVCGFIYYSTEPKLVHNYDTEWTYDDTAHWKQCIDIGYEQFKKDYSAHTFNTEVVDEPTFEAEGHSIHTCTECGYFYETTEEKLSHNYSSQFESDENHHWHVCTDEGYEDVISEKEEHDYTVVTTESTFETHGKNKYRCKICNYTYEEELPLKEHNFSDEFEHDDTYHWHMCTDPNYTQLESEKIEHDYETTVVPSTYEKQGYTLHTCKECGYSYKDNYTDVLEHHFSTEWENDEWTHWHVCTDPGYSKLKGGQAVHDYEVISFTPATFTEHSQSLLRCVDCGYETIEIGTGYKPHSYYDEWVSDISYHWHMCKDAGYETLESEKIPHELGEYVIETMPTATEDGMIARVCNVCGHHVPWQTVDKSAYQLINNFTTSNYNDGVQITGYSGSLPETVLIPDEIGGKKVYSINSSLFSYNSTIKNVYIFGSINSISSYAFQNCNSLKLVILGPNITTLNSYAFYYCNKLECINLERITSVGNRCFDNCPSLLEVRFEASSLDIYGYAFNQCSKLTSVYISPNTYMTTINNYCFYMCSSLMYLTLPNNLQTINGNAFRYCTSLEKVRLPDNVRYIYQRAFGDCTSLKEITLDSGLEYTDGNVFYNCSSLEKVFHHYTEEYKNYHSIYINTNVSPATYNEYFYSASSPSVVGYYWRYVNGVETPWY